MDAVSPDEQPIQSAAQQEAARLSALADDPQVVRLVDLIISQAVADGATEIRLDLQPRGIEVYYRVDGFLYPVMSAPGFLFEGTLARLKLIALMDVLDRRDQAMGPVRLQYDGRDLHLFCRTRLKDEGEVMSLEVVWPT